MASLSALIAGASSAPHMNVLFRARMATGCESALTGEPDRVDVAGMSNEPSGLDVFDEPIGSLFDEPIGSMEAS